MHRYLVCFLSLIATALSTAAQNQSINLYPDSLHAPFIYGVASGDPTDTSVVLWTAIEPDSASQVSTIDWQLATDSTFATIVRSGQGLADSSSGFAYKVYVDSLAAYTHFCYRFGVNSAWSVTGFTITAPSGPTDSLQFAVVSCSSLFSGYFNGYRQISRLHNLNAVIHLGDYIYDFVDPEERVRIPQPEPPNPSSLNDWRNRYKLYALDPDLREARRRHPWIQIWDNHEVKPGGPKIRVRAFEEFNPIRVPDVADSSRDWRRLNYGTLVDIVMIDMNTFPDVDTLQTGARMIMTRPQYTWLLNQLDSSNAEWKILGSGKMFSPWYLGAFGNLLPGAGLGETWNGYPENRDSLLAFVADHHINNLVVVSGDLHMNISSDLARNPFDSTQYNPRTGLGALGVEMMGTSISRGNLDESGVPANLAPSLNTFSLDSNPQQVYTNMFDHGYAILKLNADSMTATMNLCPILMLSDSQNVEATLVCKAGENRWHRTFATGINVLDNMVQGFNIYPNPTSDVLYIAPTTSKPWQTELVDLQGKVLFTGSNTTQISTQSLANGEYLVRFKQNGKTFVKRFVKVGK